MYSKLFKNTTIMLVCLFVVTACVVSPNPNNDFQEGQSTNRKCTPKWYEQTPKEDGFRFSVGYYQLPKQQQAINRARIQA